MKIKTHLISGAGNTFHVAYIARQLDGAPQLSLQKMKEISATACKKNSADGFIFLSKSSADESDNEYKWWFYNNDGSDAEMCGNATRCVGYFLKNIAYSPHERWQLKTVAGSIGIEFIEKEKYKITMTPIKKFQSGLGFYCDTGVPHLVIEKKNIIADEALRQSARSIRQHEEFLPKGTNVTYVTLDSDEKKIKAISYERGVEDFTAACGTGAVAAAFYNLTKRGVKQTQVEMPGGTLMMDLSELSRPSMAGPAVLLGSFEYEISI